MRKMLAGAALAGAVAIFSFAFSGSLHCDPQEIGDGFAPAKGGQAPRAGSSSQAGQASGAKTPETKKAAAASGSEFRAEDGLFTCRIPGGWKVRPANIGGTTVQVLEPEKGGDERILVTAVPSTVSSLQELTQQAITLVTQQLLPGSRVAEMPKFTQQGDMQVAEIRYVVMTGAGQATWWHGLMLKDGIALGVLGGARSDRAQAVEQQCRDVLYSMCPGKVQANPALAAAIIGQWSYYSRSGLTKGSVHKQIAFWPNGRFDYTATTYIPDMPPDINPTTKFSGTYQLNGNILIGRADNGQQANYTLELVQGGGLKINGELFIRDR